VRGGGVSPGSARALDQGGGGPCPWRPDVMFLHIPKTAGTSIEDAAFTRGICWGRYMRFLPRSLGGDGQTQGLPAVQGGPVHFMQHGAGSRGKRNETRVAVGWSSVSGRPCTIQHTPPRLFTPHSPYIGKKVFCVVRNPFDRVVSEFRYRFAVTPREVKGCSAKTLNDFVHRNFAQKSLIKSVAGHSPMTQGVTSAPSLMLHHWRADCHFLPQVSYLHPSRGGVDPHGCTEVVHFEDLDSGVLSTLLHRHRLSQIVVSEHYDFHGPSRGAPCRVDVSNLSHSSVEILQEAYREDFLHLGYSVTPR